MGAVLAERPRSRGTTIVALVLVSALLLQMIASLAFPEKVPRLVVLPAPASEIRCPGTQVTYEQSGPFWRVTYQWSGECNDRL